MDAVYVSGRFVGTEGYSLSSLVRCWGGRGGRREKLADRDGTRKWGLQGRAPTFADAAYNARQMDKRLIIEHIPRLRRYARALVGDRYVADDRVQDTLERAWNKFYLWRPGSDLRAWLFTIMHNVFVNQARRRRYEIEQPMDEIPVVPVRATQTEQLELQDVDRALRSLPAEQREVILLVAVEQMSYDEASRALDIPIGTVMSRLSRARERMRQLLGGQTMVPLKAVK